MTRPETRDARSGDVNIASQIVGEGPRDLVLVPGWVSNLPSLATRMDDVRAVMDAVRSSRAALLGYSEGGPMCALFVPGEWHLFAVGKDTQP